MMVDSGSDLHDDSPKIITAVLNPVTKSKSSDQDHAISLLRNRNECHVFT